MYVRVPLARLVGMVLLLLLARHDVTAVFPVLERAANAGAAASTAAGGRKTRPYVSPAARGRIGAGGAGLAASTAAGGRKTRPYESRAALRVCQAL